MTMVEQLFTEDCSDQNRRAFVERFDSLVTKPLSKNWIKKEHGYVNLNRFAD